MIKEQIVALVEMMLFGKPEVAAKEDDTLAPRGFLVPVEFVKVENVIERFRPKIFTYF